MKNFLYTIGIATLITLSACGKKEENMMEKNQTLSINRQGDFASIHPHTGMDLGCRNIIISLFENLFRIDANDHSQKALVDYFEISESQLVYTFTLKKSYWSNGEPLTAMHFEHAWKKALAPDSSCLRPDLFYPIKNSKKAKKGELSIDEIGVQAIDASTLRVELEHPTPYFLDLLAHPIFSPLYDDQKEPSVFNGPFTIAQWKREEEMVLQKNPHYWDAKNVFLNRVIISLVRDPATAVLLFEQGELDWVGSPFSNIPLDLIPYLKNKSEFHTKTVSGVYWLSLNHQKFPFQEKKIRKALSLTINRDEIADKLHYGMKPTATILPPSLSLLSEEENNCKQDLEAGKISFEEGLKTLQLTKADLAPLQILYSDIPGQKNVAQTLQQVWQDALGIKVELINSEWNLFFSNLTKRNYQIGGCNWYASYSDPIYYLEFFKELENRYNAAAWNNTEYRELLELAEKSIDLKARTNYLRQAELILLEECPVIPIFVYDYHFMHKNEIEGIHLSNLGLLDLKSIRKVPEASFAK